MRFQKEPLICTQGYRPTVYDLALIDDGGEVFEIDGI